MVKNQLVDTKLELLQGSALLEVGELDKAQALAMTIGSANIEFAKKGLFRVDMNPARIRVFDGSALVMRESERLTLKEGKEAMLDSSSLTAEKFDKEDDDAFYRWASRRSGYIAAANVVAAKRAYDGSMSYTSSSWVYNPYFGMFTYMPYGGMYMSPFGYRYYNPMTVGRFYYRPAPVMGYSGGLASAPAYAGPAYTGSTGQQSVMSGAHGSIGSSGGHTGGFSQGAASSGGGGARMSGGGGGGHTGGGGLGHR